MPQKSFTSRTDTIPFDINGVDYEAAGALGADPFIEFLGVVGDLGKVGEQAKAATDAAAEEEGGSFDIETLKKQKDLMAKAVTLALLPESAERIIAGLSMSGGPSSVPLDILQDVLMWLMAEYKLAADDEDDTEDDEEATSGDRPTQRTPDSETGSSPTGGGSGAASSGSSEPTDSAS